MRNRSRGGASDLNPLAEVRQERMAELVWDEGFARVTDLAGRFGVSAVTVRADLTALEARARVRRVRGSGLNMERPSKLDGTRDILATPVRAPTPSRPATYTTRWDATPS